MAKNNLYQSFLNLRLRRLHNLNKETDCVINITNGLFKEFDRINKLFESNLSYMKRLADINSERSIPEQLDAINTIKRIGVIKDSQIALYKNFIEALEKNRDIINEYNKAADSIKSI